VKPTTPAHGVVGHLNPDSRRLFKPLQQGEGGEDVFQAADVLVELPHGSRQMPAHLAVILCQQLADLFGGQVVDGDSARLSAAPPGNPTWPVPSLKHRLLGLRAKAATGIGV
jgi:hypothetical protein